MISDGGELESLRTLRYPVRDGIRLNCAQSAAEGREAVLLLHGYTDSWFSFARVFAGLARHYHVIAPDQRGHGDSDRPIEGYSMSALADDAVALLDTLGVERATVVGHCMGGYVAQRLASRYPERVERLVLVDSALTFTNDVIRELGQAVAELPDPVPVEFVRDFQLSTVHIPPPAAFMDRIVAASCKLPARVWCSLMEGMQTDTPEIAAAITVPTLVLWGDQDTVFSRDEQRRLVASIPGARWVVYPGCGHAPHWEWPARVVTDVLQFAGAPQRQHSGDVMPTAQRDALYESSAATTKGTDQDRSMFSRSGG